MDGIQLFDKKEKELETLTQAVRIYNYDIGMEFGIEKSAMQTMKSRKREIMEGIELPNQGKVRLGENKHLGIPACKKLRAFIKMDKEGT